MGNTIPTPYMLLQLPIPTVELGPAWAAEINIALNSVDAHDHSIGKGTPVTPAGLNISSDLLFNSNNATALRSTRYTSQGAAFTGAADVGCLYVVGNELYYNDVTGGHQIPITFDGNVTGAAGTITGLPSGTASAAYDEVSGTFIFQQSTSTAANLDVGSLVLRYPGSYPTPTGNYILLEVPSSISSGYALVLPALPAQTNVMTLSNAGVMSSITYDAVGAGMTATGANAIAASRTRTTGSTVGIGGVAISSSSGNFSTQSTSYVAVGSLSCALTTSGRPVQIMLIDDGSLDSYILLLLGAAAANSAFISITRNGTQISNNLIGIGTSVAGANNEIPVGSINFLDIVGAGTYTYAITARVGNATVTLNINLCKLVAFEI